MLTAEVSPPSPEHLILLTKDMITTLEINKILEIASNSSRRINNRTDRFASISSSALQHLLPSVDAIWELLCLHLNSIKIPQKFQMYSYQTNFSTLHSFVNCKAYISTSICRCKNSWMNGGPSNIGYIIAMLFK